MNPRQQKRRDEAVERARKNWERTGPRTDGTVDPKKKFKTLEDYLSLFDGTNRKVDRLKNAEP